MNTVKVTPELIQAITNAVRTWKKETLPMDEEDQHFDEFCEQEHGLKVEFGLNGHAVIVLAAEIIDEEKYINFLLRFG